MKTLISTVMHPDLAALHALWRRFVSDREARRDGAELTHHFQRFLDHIVVIDIDSRRYTYRHYGRAFVSSFGTDLAGQTIDYIPCDVLPIEQRNILEFEYNFVHRTRRVVWRSYTAPFAGRLRTWQRLVLPVPGDAVIVGAYEIADALPPGPPIDRVDQFLWTVIDTVPIYLDEDGGVGGLAISLKEFAAIKGRERELESLATTDPLTGLYNLRHFSALANQEIRNARLTGASLTVMMLDIDHFKVINDTHGHAVGDEALRYFAEACKVCLRKSDVLGRCGGEEFAIVLPDTTEPEAWEVAERLRRSIADLRLPVGPAAIGFTVSIGIATAPPGSCGGDATIIDLLSRADQALYRAKACGRNRVVLDPH